jgi:hypothetical protein
MPRPVGRQPAYQNKTASLQNEGPNGLVCAGVIVYLLQKLYINNTQIIHNKKIKLQDFGKFGSVITHKAAQPLGISVGKRPRSELQVNRLKSAL